MRFVLAISSLVLAGVLLVLGIGQATFLAGPKQTVYAAEFDGGQTALMLQTSEVALLDGQATLVVEGSDAFIATGHVRDVSAWLAPFAHQQLAVDAAAESLQLTAVPQDEEAAKAYLALDGAVVNEEAAQESATEEGADPEQERLRAIVPPAPYHSDLWIERQGGAADNAEEETASESPADAESGTGDETQDAQGEAVAASQVVRLPLTADLSRAALITAGEGTAKVSIEWVHEQNMPWAGPLLTAGGFFALLGAVFYLLAVDNDRRGLGPQRGRRGPLLGIRNLIPSQRSKSAGAKGDAVRSELQANRRAKRGLRGASVSGAMLAVMLTVTACAPNYWPQFSQQPATQEEVMVSENQSGIAPVPVTQSQIDHIVSDIVAVAGAADAALDGTELDTRFTGDALAQRLANYKIRASVADYEIVVPRITDRALGYQLVRSTEQWPRTIFVVVESENGNAAEAEAEAEAAEPAEAAEGDAETAQESASPSLALIMTQSNPYENYLVSRVIALRGGITMPEAAPAAEGTALLADDLASLVVTPAEVGDLYAAVLAGGAEVEAAQAFDLSGDSLIERSGAAWVAQSTAAAASAGQGIVYSVTAAESDAGIVSLSTGIGGALVATTVRETRVEEPDGGRWRPTVPDRLAALSGLSGQQEKLVSVVAHQLLFYVPSATDGGAIQMLGFSSDLVEARNS